MKAELDFIWRRRSIRKYTPQAVSDELIEEILKAGMAAPSAHNRQPWHFIVIRERQTLDRIAEKHPYAKMLFGAPLAIVVCGDTTVSAKRWDQDCAAATENILLALPALGLGGVWIGYHPIDPQLDFLRPLLELPEHIKVFCLIGIGYPAETKEPRTQYQQTVVHYERW
jgi:nitroreductase